MKRNLLTILLAFFVVFSLNAQKADFVNAKSGKVDLNTKVIKSTMQTGLRSGKIDYISEAFDAGIPGTWIVANNGTGVGWIWTGGTPYIDSDAAGSSIREAGELWSPTVDVSGETALTLTFDHYYNNISSGELCEVDVWDGMAWVNVAAYLEDHGTSSSDMEHVEIDVSAYINEFFTVRFNYDDNDIWAWYWYIDNVVVFSPEADDLGVDAIAPTSFPTGTETPQVTVHNYGGSDQATWSIQLADGASYDETIVDPGNITAGGDLVVDFPDWTPGAGLHTLTATVTLSGDANPGNDVLVQDVLVYDMGDPIYEQHELITIAGGGFNGADLSELQSALGMGTYGTGFSITGPYSITDDIVVAADETWTINGFQFYGYQTGSPTDPSSINEIIIRVFDGDPSAGGTVIQDFWSTNSLVASAWTGIYRALDTDPTGNLRPIMFMACAVPEFTLTEGTYWIEWAAGGTLASGPWAPARTLAGETTTGNAMQNVAGAYAAFIDVGPQGVCFDVMGSISTEGVAPITFIVDNTANTSFTGFALKGSWDTGGNYDSGWNGGLEHTDFYDDGTNGDVTAGDNIWTVMQNLVADGGANTWMWGVNDQDGEWIDGDFEFTVTDDTPQTLEYATLSVNELTEGSISIYPNPSSGIFNVNVNNNMNLEVIDMTGKVINTQVLTGNSTVEINTAGVYFFKFSNEDGFVTKRVIVQ